MDSIFVMAVLHVMLIPASPESLDMTVKQGDKITLKCDVNHQQWKTIWIGHRNDVGPFLILSAVTYYNNYNYYNYFHTRGSRAIFSNEIDWKKMSVNLNIKNISASILGSYYCISHLNQIKAQVGSVYTLRYEDDLSTPYTPREDLSTPYTPRYEDLSTPYTPRYEDAPSSDQCWGPVAVALVTLLCAAATALLSFLATYTWGVYWRMNDIAKLDTPRPDQRTYRGDMQGDDDGLTYSEIRFPKKDQRSKGCKKDQKGQRGNVQLDASTPVIYSTVSFPGGHHGYERRYS